jgi:hypothetical protein
VSDGVPLLVSSRADIITSTKAARRPRDPRRERETHRGQAMTWAEHAVHLARLPERDAARDEEEGQRNGELSAERSPERAGR